MLKGADALWLVPIFTLPGRSGGLPALLFPALLLSQHPAADASCCGTVQVAAGSLVLKDVPPKIMVAGSPARPVGKVSGALFLLTI